jgi:hypothetical protein
LRELLTAVQTVSDAVLEHHMLRCALEDYFELYEFPNDLARWCWEALGDKVLAERLGLIDPYQLGSLAAVRAELVNVIDERVWSLDHPVSCRPGMELHWVGSRLVAYDTGDRLSSPVALAEALPRLSLRSLFYHVHEGRRRTEGRTDDFSAWLEANGADAGLVQDIRNIDFYFLNLNQFRAALLGVFRQRLPEFHSVGK